MGKFKGQTIQLGGPERALPTTSTGMDIRDVRSQGSFPRTGGRFEDRGSRGDRPERSFDDAPRRSGFRDDGEAPRRTFSRRSDEEGGSRAEDAGDWRSSRPATGDAIRTTESGGFERRGSTREEGFERRSSTRDEGFERRSSAREEKPVTAADTEDDWRAGAPSRTTSGFGERRAESRREDDSSAPRRFGSRQEDDASSGLRRFGSRQEVATKADEEDDWRRGGPSTRDVAEDRSRIERTRSSRAPITKADEECDWRTAGSSTPAPSSGPVSHSATPWNRRQTGSSEMATPMTSKKDSIRPPIIASAMKEKATPVSEKLVEDRWSSESESEDEVVVAEVKPDMEKISKFIERVEKLICPITTESLKKMDSLVKKIPVNFTHAEFGSLETSRAVIRASLKSLSTGEDSSEVAPSAAVLAAVAPILLCLEHHYIEFGHSVNGFYLDILETVQCWANSRGLPRISPECSLVEDLWLALYEAKIIPEEAFQLWLDNDTLPSPGKSVTLFQTEAFRAWLYEQELPGVEATVKTKAGAKDEWGSDSEDDSDIESLIPKRAGAPVLLKPTTPLRR